MGQLALEGLTQVCTGCAQALPIEEFAWRSDRGRRRRKCRACRAEAGGRLAPRTLPRETSVALLAQGKKRCCACQKILPTGEFVSNAPAQDGLTYRCRACHAAWNADWRAANPERVRAMVAKRDRLTSRRAKLRHKYKMELEQFDAMLASQGGRCAICSVVLAEGGRGGPNVDHCHSSGRVRGILCASCNQGLGHFADNAERLRSAIEYLETSARRAEP